MRWESGVKCRCVSRCKLLCINVMGSVATGLDAPLVRNSFRVSTRRYSVRMKVKEAMAKLQALGSERVRAQNLKNGASENQFGVRLGDIRKLAKEIKSNHELALELWETQNVDARFLAILCMKPKLLAPEQLDELVRSERFTHAADWLTRYVVKKHPRVEDLRLEWMDSEDPMTGRAAWSLTADRVAKNADGLDLVALLDRVESEMETAVPEVQWTMNWCLGEIGIHFPKLRKRARAIGESLGLYRDYPVSKGCVSPFVPIFIDEMVSRQAEA